jgi:hypothetical protein
MCCIGHSQEEEINRFLKRFNRLIFLIEMRCVFFEVGTQCLYIQMSCTFQQETRDFILASHPLRNTNFLAVICTDLPEDTETELFRLLHQ